MTRAQRLNPGIRWDELTVILTDDLGIADAHERVFGRRSVTDVISLPYAPMLPAQEGHIAEIIINVQCAVEEGTRRRGAGPAWSAEQELALYVAHGCDHLAGEDDRTGPDRRRMRRRELRWVKEAARQGLLLGLFPECANRGGVRITGPGKLRVCGPHDR